MQRSHFIRNEFATRLKAFRRDGSGVAAIEFAMIVPIMVMLFFGTVEFSQALTCDRRVAQIASSTADLVAQYDTITNAQIQNIFTITKSLMTPYTQTGLKISVTNLTKINTATPVGVSVGTSGAALYNGTYSTTVPAGLLDNGGTGTVCVVMSEVVYPFTPTIGRFLTSAVTLSEKFYSKPRKVPCVTIT